MARSPQQKTLDRCQRVPNHLPWHWFPIQNPIRGCRKIEDGGFRVKVEPIKSKEVTSSRLCRKSSSRGGPLDRTFETSCGKSAVLQKSWRYHTIPTIQRNIETIDIERTDDAGVDLTTAYIGVTYCGAEEAETLPLKSGQAATMSHHWVEHLSPYWCLVRSLWVQYSHCFEDQCWVRCFCWDCTHLRRPYTIRRLDWWWGWQATHHPSWYCQQSTLSCPPVSWSHLLRGRLVWHRQYLHL